MPQARVNGTIKDIDGRKVQKLEFNKLSIAVESGEVKEELIETIEKDNFEHPAQSTI